MALVNKPHVIQILITIMTLYVSDSVMGQSPTSTYQLIIENVKGDTANVDTLNATSRRFLAVGNYAQAKEYAEAALYLCRHDVGLTSLERSRNFKRRIPSYITLGTIGAKMGDFYSALSNYKRALEFSTEIGDIHGATNSLNNLCQLYFYVKGFDKALIYAQEILKISQKNRNYREIARAYINIGVIYIATGNLSSAEQSFRSGLSVAQKNHDSSGTAITYKNLGILYSKQDKSDQALQNYLIALEIFDVLKLDTNIAQCCIAIGHTYLILAQNDLAIKYLIKGLSLSSSYGLKDQINESRLMLAAAYAVQGDYKSAYEYKSKSTQLSDSMTLLRFISSFKLQLEGEIKEIDITELNMTYAKFQDSEWDKQIPIKFLFIVMGITLLVGVILSYSIFYVYRQKTIVQSEKVKVDALLTNILPNTVAEELKKTGLVKPRRFLSITVMFTDFKGFTKISEDLTPEQLIPELDLCFKSFDEIVTRYRIEKIKTIGDSYMCAGGLSPDDSTSPEDVVSAATEIRDFMLNYNKQAKLKGKYPFEMRIGINTGPVVAGVVGKIKQVYDIWGDTVNVASRLEGSCEPGSINISQSTYALVKDKFRCIPRGKVLMKEKGEVNMYYVEERVSI